MSLRVRICCSYLLFPVPAALHLPHIGTVWKVNLLLAMIYRKLAAAYSISIGHLNEDECAVHFGHGDGINFDPPNSDLEVLDAD